MRCRKVVFAYSANILPQAEIDDAGDQLSARLVIGKPQLEQQLDSLNSEGDSLFLYTYTNNSYSLLL